MKKQNEIQPGRKSPNQSSQRSSSEGRDQKSQPSTRKQRGKKYAAGAPSDD
tara:strand:- start:38 stop:190 length:153 start_codon:yes stop_codon:yes gene_type:complete